MLPLNCSELLPDIAPFTDFFEAVAKGTVKTEPRFSKRLFKILALRGKLFESGRRMKKENPVDILIRKTLCFYREQKEPLKPISYDNPHFIAFLRSASMDLENKVDEAIFQWEFERYQRDYYEAQLDKNSKIIRKLRHQDRVGSGHRRYGNIGFHLELQDPCCWQMDLQPCRNES